MLADSLLLKIVVDKFKLTSKDFKDYSARAVKLNKPIEQLLLDEGKIDEETLYSEAANELEVPFVSLKNKEIKKEILNLIPPLLAQTHNMVAFDRTSKELYVAILDPEDIQTTEFIQKKVGMPLKIHLTTPRDIKETLRRYHADLDNDAMIVQLSEENKVGDKDLKKVAEELPIINIVNSILEHAAFQGASDIHIEPTEKEVTVRYRVDGMLENAMTLPKTVQNGIIARIKILANLKIDEHMVPQDGRFKIQITDEKLSFRVSIIPVYDGEKIVMRLLHESQKPLTLDQLGFLAKPRKQVEEAIEKPHGMILVTGPTGSGKTTTLYSILGILNQPDVNICTIEDPIEYHVKGINQSQINPRAGFTFAGGLRAFLRQDPDVIMVGEIRDAETAEIAIHSAMTGHLVLSTLHTNDAPTTLPRLIDMGIAPFLVAFTTNIIIAQRLVRKICDNCKKEYTLEKNTFADLEKMFGVGKLAELFTTQNVKLKESEKNLQSMTFYRGEGCNKCNKSGYKGRVGIYEVLEIDKELIKKINDRATAEDIRDYATSKKMITVMQDGLIKAKMGVTTIEEVLKATKE